MKQEAPTSIRRSSSPEGFEIHHKIPKKNGGTDEYSNLIILSEYAHKIIHSTKKEIIEKYFNIIENIGGKINIKKINELRKILNLEPIIV